MSVLRTSAVALLVVLAGGVPAAAVTIATTGDGKKVLLRDDGTWKYATRDDLKAAAGIARKKEEARQDQDDNRGSASLSESRKDSRRAPAMSLVKVLAKKEGYDFRVTRWGMSRKEVMAAEKETLKAKTDSSLVYSYSLAGLTCEMIYVFNNGKLDHAEYMILSDHVDPALFYEDFEKLTAHMSDQYGNPRQRDFQWRNEMYKNDKNKWGFAISIGLLSCNVIWGSDRTKIELTITGGKHNFNTRVKYSQI